jgi:hypothetical protein
MAMFVFVFNTLADTIRNYAMDIGGKTW